MTPIDPAGSAALASAAPHLVSAGLLARDTCGDQLFVGLRRGGFAAGTATGLARLLLGFSRIVAASSAPSQVSSW